MKKLIGKLICFLFGHERGDTDGDDGAYTFCWRCQ